MDLIKYAFLIVFSLTFFILIFYFNFKVKLNNERREYIKNFEFSEMIKLRLKNQHFQNINNEDLQRIIFSLQTFFLMVLENKGTSVAMPSKVVDIAWHEFILCTKDYAEFCQKAFGKFLHHTPTERMKSPTESTNGILNCWTLACELENIDPENPKSLPSIFSIDSEFNIKDGFYYTLDCTQFKDNKNPKYCVIHIAEELKNSRSSSGGCGGATGSSGCGGD